MLTASGTIENKLSGFDAGTDNYVLKPSEFSKLLARIQVNRKRSLQPYNPEGTSQLTMTDLREKTVGRAGQAIN